MSLSFDISAADLINEQLRPSLKRKLTTEEEEEVNEPKKLHEEIPTPEPPPEPALPLLLPVPFETTPVTDPPDQESAMATTLGHLNKTGMGFDFQLLDENSFDKIYEIMVLASIIKTYPEIVTDLQINRTSLSTLDDATRRHKFLECKLYVLIDLECQNMKALTGVFTALLKLGIHMVSPVLSKTTETVLNTSLANVDKKSNALFYIHAVNAVKKREFVPPNILFGFFTEMVKVVTVILSEYLLSIQQKR